MKVRNSVMSEQTAPITIRRIMSKGRNKHELLPGQMLRWDCDNTPGSDPDNWVTIEGHCVVTKQPHSITVLNSELDKWLEGDISIQHCINVEADDREFLMTGISPDGWKIMFPPAVGEEDE